jgi:hypothetical protein
MRSFLLLIWDLSVPVTTVSSLSEKTIGPGANSDIRGLEPHTNFNNFRILSIDLDHSTLPTELEYGTQKRN